MLRMWNWSSIADRLNAEHVHHLHVSADLFLVPKERRPWTDVALQVNRVVFHAINIPKPLGNLKFFALGCLGFAIQKSSSPTSIPQDSKFAPCVRTQIVSPVLGGKL